MTDPIRTPDGRYIVVGGRLWRATNPSLNVEVRERYVAVLMDARRRVRSKDLDLRAAARRDIDAAKIALGERGPVWWDDGAPDLNRRLIRNTPYAEWYRSVVSSSA